MLRPWDCAALACPSCTSQSGETCRASRDWIPLAGPVWEVEVRLVSWLSVLGPLAGESRAQAPWPYQVAVPVLQALSVSLLLAPWIRGGKGGF